MATQADTLTSAIEKAVETHKSEEETQTTETQQTQTEETTETKPPEKKADEQVVDLDAENGKILIQALRNPEQAAILVDYLAKQAGYTKADLSKLETKSQVAEATTDITDILKAELGEEFSFLAPKLGNAIKKVLESTGKQSEETADLRARIEVQERREIQKETEATHVAISREYFDSDDMPENVLKAMSTAMDQFPPTKGLTPSQYYRKVFYLVAGEMSLAKKQQRGTVATDKITKNKSDASVRNLSSQQRGITPGDEPTGSKRMSIDESIKAAMKSLEEQGKK